MDRRSAYYAINWLGLLPGDPPYNHACEYHKEEIRNADTEGGKIILTCLCKNRSPIIIEYDST